MDFAAFTTSLQALGNGDADIAFLQRYVGTSLPMLGIKTDALRGLVLETIKQGQGRVAEVEWYAWLSDLYAGPFHEHRLAGGFTLHALPALRREIELARLRGWLNLLAGWCAVDTTCQNGWKARDLLGRWEEWEPFLDGLNTDQNSNLRRASLVLLNAPLRESADSRLSDRAFASIDRLKDERDPLIAKAVSWSLRTLTKQHADEVRAWLAASGDSLTRTVRREVETKLETGKKNG